MNSEYHNNTGSRSLLGTIIIIIGALYLLRTLDFINLNVTHIFFSFPFILFVIGIIILINSGNKIFGLILAFIGAVFLLPRVFPNIELNSDIIFPVLIIAFGIHILFKRRIHSCHNYSKHWEKVVDEKLDQGFKNSNNWEYRRWKTNDKDYIDDIAIFGGGHKTIISDNFKGGNITAIFGGSEIDLTQCKLAEGDVIIDAIMIFGGTTIIIPKEWNVRVNITPIFGGFSNKVFRNPGTPIDTTRTLVIKGVAILGGGEIKYY
jgi:predicted membrane protein